MILKLSSKWCWDSTIRA